MFGVFARARLLFVVTALAFAMGCKAKAADPVKEPKEDGVDVKLAPKALEAARLATAHPRETARRTSVTGSGTVDFVPSRVARVGPPVAGRVGAIPAVPGQKVTKGTVLVLLESAEVGRSRGDFLAARSRLEQANAEVEREKRLLAGGATSDRALLLAQTEQATAQAQLRATEDRLATMGLGGAAAGQSVPLVSPIAGTVLEVKARTGQPVGPTDSLVVVGETDQVWLPVEIYERDMGRVHVGDDVRVTSVAFPGRVFEGHVDQLGAVVDPDRHVLEARVVLGNHDGALKPGMTATARILGASEADAGSVLVVPRIAVQTIDGQAFVFVQREAGKYEMRAVERGSEVDGEVEVARGLVAGDTIVTDGSFILKSEALKAQMGAND